ncbi:MAG TPA: hypothetical protein V6C81_12550 [Planktothrix sp.]|jgi:hypothetical protein
MHIVDRIAGFPRRWLMHRVNEIREHGFHRYVPIEKQLETVEQKITPFLIMALSCAVFIGVVNYFWPWAIPFKFFELWQPKGTITEWLWTSRWILGWGTGVTLLMAFLHRDKLSEIRNAESEYLKDCRTAIQAGVLEEICFRWLQFMAFIVTARVANFLFFGFLGFGVPHWLMLHFFGPVSNWFTLGLLGAYLINPANWVVGLAIIKANSSFRDGHKYLGLFGFINSWFIGMFFFYLMFQYGLLAGIIVHALYDFLIFTVKYLHMLYERAAGTGAEG